MNLGTFPGCCKIFILYGFGNCSDFPEKYTSAEIKDWIIERENYYSSYILLIAIVPSQKKQMLPVLKELEYSPLMKEKIMNREILLFGKKAQKSKKGSKKERFF